MQISLCWFEEGGPSSSVEHNLGVIAPKSGKMAGQKMKMSDNWVLISSFYVKTLKFMKKRRFREHWFYEDPLFSVSLKNTTSLFQSIIEASRPIKTKVLFLHYRIELGIQQLLSYARTGIKDWFKPTQPNRDQYRLRLPA